VPKKPRVGSVAWEKELVNSPTFAKNTILSLAKRAEGGNKEAVERLNGWLARFPEMRPLVRELDDLATRVERAWVQRMCGTNELAKKAIEDDVAAMKAELLGPTPSVTDKILAASVVVSHLAFQRAALFASVILDKPEVQAARERLLTMAQKRLEDTVKGWELHAKKKARGLKPRAKLKLFDGTA
jgi:hypothetical protein